MAAQSEGDEDNYSHSYDNVTDTSRPKYKTAAGRTIFGGGGITPDFIVRNDTLQSATKKILATGVFSDYVEEYVDQHVGDIKKAGDADYFIKNFRITDAMFNDFLKRVKDKKVDVDMDKFNIDRPWLAIVLRAEIGARIYGNDVLYRIRLEDDRQYQKAYSVLGEATRLAADFK